MKWKSSAAIIGGGLAGIAAADTALKKGYRVTLFESAGRLGGRLASLFEPNVKRYIDTGQHVFLDCCPNLIELNESLNLSQFFQTYRSISYVDINARHWILKKNSWLPKSWQCAFSLFRLPFLSFSDRLALGKLIDTFQKERNLTGNFADYLRKHRVSEKSIRNFWEPFVLSTLSETLDNAATVAVHRIFCGCFDGLLKMFIPTVPLHSIYNDAAAENLKQRGVEIRFFSRIRRLHCDDGQKKITAIELTDGLTATFDKYILAVPFLSLGKILESSQLTATAEMLQLDHFELGAITTIHLWLDQVLVKESQPFSILLGGIGQFLCRPQHGANNDRFGYYHTVVVSASHRLLSDRELAAGKNELLANRILDQLRAAFRVPDLQLRYHRITTNFEAVFCPSELVFDNRPAAQTQFDNLTLAGDWTQTGLPATMEGAVVSGINAVPET